MLQHHEDVSELDYIFLYHEMEANQILMPTKCKSSSTTDLSIEILNLDEFFLVLIAMKSDEVIWVQFDPMCDEESFCFNLGLKSEIAINDDCSECEYDATYVLELCGHSDFYHLNASTRISLKSDYIKSYYIKSYECENVAVPFLEVCDHFYFQQRMVGCTRNDVQEGIEKLEIYDEAWLFGKYFWVTNFLHYGNFIFREREFARRAWFWFSLEKHNTLHQRGSYFSFLVNGHV